MPARAERTKLTACSVVTCSSTIGSSAKRSLSGASTSDTKRASRSNTSTLGSVSSPWMQSGSPCSAIASSTGNVASRLWMPASELVVAPAGESLTACRCGSAAARRTSSGGGRGVTAGGLGGRPGGVALAAGRGRTGAPPPHLVGSGAGREIQGHEGLEPHVAGRRQYAPPVRQRLLDGLHRRHEIGHHQRAPE